MRVSRHFFERLFSGLILSALVILVFALYPTDASSARPSGRQLSAEPAGTPIEQLVHVRGELRRCADLLGEEISATRHAQYSTDRQTRLEDIDTVLFDQKKIATDYVDSEDKNLSALALIENKIDSALEDAVRALKHENTNQAIHAVNAALKLERDNAAKIDSMIESALKNK